VRSFTVIALASLAENFMDVCQRNEVVLVEAFDA
jgi:hypothetical protein